MASAVPYTRPMIPVRRQVVVWTRRSARGAGAGPEGRRRSSGVTNRGFRECRERPAAVTTASNAAAPKSTGTGIRAQQFGGGEIERQGVQIPEVGRGDEELFGEFADGAGAQGVERGVRPEKSRCGRPSRPDRDTGIWPPGTDDLRPRLPVRAQREHPRDGEEQRHAQRHQASPKNALQRGKGPADVHSIRRWLLVDRVPQHHEQNADAFGHIGPHGPLPGVSISSRPFTPGDELSARKDVATAEGMLSASNYAPPAHRRVRRRRWGSGRPRRSTRSPDSLVTAFSEVPSSRTIGVRAGRSPTTPWRPSSAGRRGCSSSWSAATGSLSHGRNGRPRPAEDAAAPVFDSDGWTPNRLHSSAERGDRQRMASRTRGDVCLQTRLSRSSGGGRASLVVMRGACSGGAWRSSRARSSSLRSAKASRVSRNCCSYWSCGSL